MSIVNMKLKPLSIMVAKAMPAMALIVALGECSTAMAVNTTPIRINYLNGLPDTVVSPNDATIITTNEVAINVTGGANLHLIGNTTIQSDDTSIYSSDSNVTIDNNISIISNSDSVINSRGSNINITGGLLLSRVDDANAIEVRGGIVTLNNTRLATEGLVSSTITIGSNGTGSDGTVNLNNTIVTTKQGDADSILLLFNDYGGTTNGGVFNARQSTLTTDGEVGFYAEGGNWTVNLDNTSLSAALGAIYVGDYRERGDTVVNVSAINNSVINGGLAFTPEDSTSKIVMTMDKSILNGATRGQNQIDLTMNNNSSFNIIESSQLNKLTLSNSSVSFAAPTSQNYKTLSANTLSGTGDFHINTVLNEGAANTQSDLIHVLGDASGHYKLYVNKSGSGAATADNGIKVVQIDGATLNSELFKLGNEVSIGQYDYYLFEGSVDGSDSNDWYLRSEVVIKPDSENTAESNDSAGTQRPSVSFARKEFASYIASPYINMLYGYQSVGTLHERMGDSQQFARGADNKTWGRFVGQHLDSKAGRFNYDIDTMFAQFGHDLYQYQTEAGTSVTAGATVTLGKTTTDAHDKYRTYVGDSIDTGSIDTNNYSIGGYYTRYAQDGGYIDAVTQFTYYDTHFNSRYDADQKGYGLILSLEGGKPYAVTENWKIEPQGQIAYQLLKSEDFHDQKGDIQGDNNSTGLARAGVRLFRDQAQDKASEIFKPYLTLDAVSSLSKAPSVNVAGNDMRADFDTSWWQAGAGVTANVTKNTSLYMDAKYLKSFEGDLDGYSVHVGVQARF
ncbi:MAG: autotransporter outer membrane beta-barrel domain-containing protein [Enterobacteriaceae bacterium]|jgi:outer membrane autotransporter protein|nr:autotransporter outer membrane beta-barrel domain-containing protein [Enterobacteriaceae bacterium]